MIMIMINILFNGKDFVVEEGKTLLDFLKQNFSSYDKIAVEVDLEVIPKSQYSTFILQSGMKLEAITFVGGG